MKLQTFKRSRRGIAAWMMAAIFAVGSLAPLFAETTGRAPNIIIIFADDMGYGDLGAYGHPTIRTPHLDRMAAEGQKWNSFYVAASVCTPSRAALLTGRYPVRNGMTSDERRVLFPDSAGGLPQEEITLARVLKKSGYATACIGKWHLGHLPEFLPTRHGFDYYYGIPYSNDMDNVSGKNHFQSNYPDPKVEYFNVPLMRNEEIIERPADQRTLTRRYTREVIGFIEKNREKPFLIYYAQTFPHVPLFASDEFRGRSLAGLYGDVLEEMDWSVGEIRRALEQHELSENTLVVFTSDNGPWLPFKEHGGIAGPLREGKGTPWEGGMRVPAIFWWPGRIQPQVVMEIGASMDLFTTVIALTGGELPADRVLDGLDLSPTLLGTGSHPRDNMVYYDGIRVFAARLGPWKAHFRTRSSGKVEQHDPPLLYHLGRDSGERFNVAQDHPEIVARIAEFVRAHQASVQAVPSQLEARIGRN